jgi:hypothetical protein
MPVYRFTIPGHSTRREFAVYVVVARKRETAEFKIYVGKTGDNRDGCNPVISRAGNHFSYNDIHSQVRNKLDAHAHEFDYEYFYVTFDQYDGENHRDKIDVVNEMERSINRALKGCLSPNFVQHLMNEHKGSGYVKPLERIKRQALMTPERSEKVKLLIGTVVEYLASVRPEAVVDVSQADRQNQNLSNLAFVRSKA